MISNVNSLIIIPTRLASTRLPNKPLADINGKSMIQHVWEGAKKCQSSQIIIACGDQKIVDESKKFSANAILTDPNHPSGSDRIYEALTTFGPDGKFDIIINYQGDIPVFNASILDKAIQHFLTTGADILTFTTKLNPSQYENANDVKAIVDDPSGSGRALYFTRRIPQDAELYAFYHIGLYIYKRAALEKFVKTPPSPLERKEKLEQLRALSLGMHIETLYIDEIPLGVDTPEDLEKARQLLI